MSKQIIQTKKLALNSNDKKPSVFERLGTKPNVIQKISCRNCVQNGTCSHDKHCRISQSNIIIKAIKKFKSNTMKKSSILHKKCKDLHKKTVHSCHSSDLEWEGWELADLEDADEKVLEKRKQELQRELQLQVKKEKELKRKKELKVNKKRAPSTSSSSAATDSSSSTSSTSTSSSEPAKRSSRKRKHSSSSSESAQSSRRQKKTAKTLKTKSSAFKKQVEKKIFRPTENIKNKTSALKKSITRKKSYSPNWEKSRDRSQSKLQNMKKSSHCISNIMSKKKSVSPHYDKIIIKNKGRGYSPKSKSNELSLKKGVKKKDSNIFGKDKIKSLSQKHHNSPSKTRKISPSLKSRRRDESIEKRRHHDDSKYILRKDHSREKEKKKEFTRGRSNEKDNNGGLKKGGKILPLKPPNYNKFDGNRKETNSGKSSDKNLFDSKIKENSEKDRERIEREKDKLEREKNKCERDKNKRKKNGDEHEKQSVREKNIIKNTARNRDERCRERESERSRLTKEKDSERQKEREEGSEKSREKIKERDRMDKEKKEKEDKKHLKDVADIKENREKELLPLLDIKSEIPSKVVVHNNHAKSTEKHLPRESHRNTDKNDKSIIEEKEGRERCSSLDRDYDRRDLLVRKQGIGGDKDHDNKRNRENGESRNAVAEIRRNLGEGRRGVEENGRLWEEVWRTPLDVFHEKKKTVDVNNGDRRQHMVNRRLHEDSYRRHARGENDGDVRDFAIDERRNASRKPASERFEWSAKDESNDYRNSETSDEWKNRSERHHDWTSRYDQKWVNRDDSRDESWNHYSRRGPREGWTNDWLKDSSRQIYTESERCQSLSEGGFSDFNGKRRNGLEVLVSTENGKNNETTVQEQVSGCSQKSQKLLKEERDALSDISDDPDDILNRDDYSAEEIPSDQVSHNSNQQILSKNNGYFFEQRKRPLFECLGERSLDFEEISDEELEEEARAGKGIADVLGADWAGLLRETRPITNKMDCTGSAHLRWTTEKLISTIGISFKYAGETFVQEFVDDHNWIHKHNVLPSNEQNEKEVQEMKIIKNEEEIQFGETELKINEFLKDYNNKEKREATEKIFHIVPGLHSVLKEDRCLKSILFSSHNRFKRALSARTDLALRRKLCNLPSKEPLHFTPPLDKKMFETSIQIFQNGQTMAAV